MVTGGAATGRSVCRSLFSRSMSVSCEVGSRRKREREEGEEGEEREGAENQLAKRRKSEFTLCSHFYAEFIYACIQVSTVFRGTTQSWRELAYSNHLENHSTQVHI